MKKTIEIDDYVAEFIEESARPYLALTDGDLGEAIAFCINLIVSQHIVRHIQPLFNEQEIKEVIQGPEQLFGFATAYLKGNREKQEADKTELASDPIAVTKERTPVAPLADFRELLLPRGHGVTGWSP